MPTYDYECQDCGHRFEKFQSMTARVMRKCPECGERTLERLIGPGGGFLFKGSGFYITDYRSKSYQDGKQSEAKPAKTESSAPPKAAQPDKKPDKKPSGGKKQD